MKKIFLALTLAGIAGLSAAQEDTQNIAANCAGGGEKSIAYDWNIYNGAISYTATLTNCTPDSGGNHSFNGTIAGNGTLLMTDSGFSIAMVTQEELSVSGIDTGSISCETGLQGAFTTATAAFNGFMTKNRCTYTVNAAGANLIDILTAITFK